MRAKSSSELTSLSSRRLLLCASVSVFTTSGGSAPARVREQVLERAEHQRQRRAELVADVREECRLGAVDLGQRRRAPALCLERLRVGEPRRNLRRHEAEERAVRVVESAHRAHAGDEDRARPVLARQLHGQRHRRVRGRRPRARRQGGEPRREIRARGRLARSARPRQAPTGRRRRRARRRAAQPAKRPPRYPRRRRARPSRRRRRRGRSARTARRARSRPSAVAAAP